LTPFLILSEALNVDGSLMKLVSFFSLLDDPALQLIIRRGGLPSTTA
jgi:hypothetical protein